MSRGSRIQAFLEGAEFFQQARPEHPFYFDPTCIKVVPGSQPCDACGNLSLAFLYPVLPDGKEPTAWVGANCLDSLRVSGKLKEA